MTRILTRMATNQRLLTNLFTALYRISTSLSRTIFQQFFAARTSFHYFWTSLTTLTIFTWCMAYFTTHMVSTFQLFATRISTGKIGLNTCFTISSFFLRILAPTFLLNLNFARLAVSYVTPLLASVTLAIQKTVTNIFTNWSCSTSPMLTCTATRTSSEIGIKNFSEK